MKVSDHSVTQSTSSAPSSPSCWFLAGSSSCLPNLVLNLELLFTVEPALPHALLQGSLGPGDVPPGQLDGDERSLPPLDGVKQGLL